MELYTGETLKEKCLEMTAGFDCRDISDFLHALMIDKRERRTIALYGLRRTGKTVMMMQEILRLNDFDRTLFVSIDEEKEDSIQDLRDALAEHPDMRYYVLDEVTYLRDFLVHSLCVRFKTEAVRTHYYSGVQDAVGADDAMRVHFHTRVENRVLADHDVVTDIRVRVDLHTLTQLHVLADIGEGTDIRVLGNGYSFADAHRLLNTLFGRVQRFRYQLKQHTHRAACVLYKNHRLSRVFESRT